MNRPAIPADLRRRVLVEAGHRCAIPTCRHLDVDIHHITPWSECQTHEYENLIALCPNCHRRATNNEIDKKSCLMYKANLRFAHDKFSQFEIDVLFELYRLPDRTGIPFLTHQSLMIKRILELQYVGIQEMASGVSIGPIKASPDILFLTKAGRDFVDSLGIKTL